jgi:acetylglutamate synthase
MKTYAQLMATITIALTASVWAIADNHADAKAAPAAAQHKEQYMVVQVGDDISVISKSQLTEEKKRIAQEYKDEMKTYELAKKDAVKKKEKFDQPKPTKHIVKILKNSLKSEQEADEWKSKYMEEHHLGGGEGAAKDAQ